MVRAVQLGAAAAIAGALLVVSGCNDSALTKTEMVVYFTQGAPQSEHVAALKACAHSGGPNVVPEKMTKSVLPSDSVGDVRFRIDHADDKDLALLTECLNKQPGVEGVDTPDLTD